MDERLTWKIANTLLDVLAAVDYELLRHDDASQTEALALAIDRLNEIDAVPVVVEALGKQINVRVEPESMVVAALALVHAAIKETLASAEPGTNEHDVIAAIRSSLQAGQ